MQFPPHREVPLAYGRNDCFLTVIQGMPSTGLDVNLSSTNGGYPCNCTG